MSTNGLCLRLTYSGSGNTLLLDNLIERETPPYSKPGSVYISEGETIELVYTSRVALSFEQGSIRQWIDDGLLTAEFFAGPTMAPALGAIDGDHAALEDPATPTELADFLDSNYQPQIATASAAYTIYVETTGDDDTGDGSITAPFATIQRALQAVPVMNSGSSTATISLGAGDFDCPRALKANYTSFVGTTSVEDTLTIDAGGVVAADDNDGVVIDVTSTGGPYADDELRGRKIEWTSGTSNGNSGWIYRNDATVGGVTRIYASQDSGGGSGVQSMSAGDTLDLITLDTSVQLQGFTVFQKSVEFNWNDVRFASPGFSLILLVNTDKVNFDGCDFDGSSFRRLLSGGGGSAWLTNCYYAASGVGGVGSFLVATDGGYIQVQRGTVLDAGLNTGGTAGRQRVEGSAGSTLSFQKHVVCRGFASDNIFEVDGIGSYVIGGTGSDDNILVEDANGTDTNQPGPVFKINANGEGRGGYYQLPNLRGSITGDYSVEAQDSATVSIGASTTIVTNLGTNTVSADGGASNVAQASDLTLIEGGSPEGGFAGRYSLAFVNADLGGGVLTVDHNLGSQYVHVSVYDDSDVLVAADSVTATSSTSCDVDLTSQGALSGTWNVVVTG